jgi:hypothetical protein
MLNSFLPLKGSLFNIKNVLTFLKLWTNICKPSVSGCELGQTVWVPRLQLVFSRHTEHKKKQIRFGSETIQEIKVEVHIQVHKHEEFESSIFINQAYLDTWQKFIEFLHFLYCWDSDLCLLSRVSFAEDTEKEEPHSQSTYSEKQSLPRKQSLTRWELRKSRKSWVLLAKDSEKAESHSQRTQKQQNFTRWGLKKAKSFINSVLFQWKHRKIHRIDSE